MPRYDKYGNRDTAITSAGDSFFLGMNNRLRPDQLEPGIMAYSQNGRMSVNGAWQPRKGIDYLGGFIDSSAEALRLPFYVYALKSILTATRVGPTVTITTTTSHAFTTATQVGIAGLTGTIDANGNRTITVTGATTFTFTIAGAPGSETYGGTGTVGSPFLSSVVNAAYGSCLFSNPLDDNEEYIIIALYDKAIAVNLATAASTDITYPASLTITENVNLLQAFNKVYIFRDGATALEFDGNIASTPTFTKVANGDYTQPKVFTAATNTACTAGVVTVTETTHGLSVGSIVTIMDKGSSPLTNADTYVVKSVPTTGTFTFYANVDDFAATSVVLGEAQSSGLGFVHSPAPAWAAYHQRRLIVPYRYTSTGTSGSEVITDRSVWDEILISDILDADTYDQLQNQLKVTAGISDYLQSVHPFTEDNAVVFNRNSIHLLDGLSGSLTDVSLKEITREAGLVAQKSVVTIGNKIFFLSDNGVYATQFGDLYNLRGAGLPLSDPIDPVIKRINSDYAQNSVAIYHDNRYFIAVPLDDATTNNAILVFNLLNQQWESVDIVAGDGWDVSNLISAGSGGINKLYAVNRLGGIHILQDREDDVDVVALGVAVPSASVRPTSYGTTRQYNFGDSDRKKFNSFELHTESTSTNTSNATISVETENVDSTTTLGNLSTYLGSVLAISEDASVRGRIGNMRGYGIQMTFTPIQGRPLLRMTRINAMQSFNSLTQAS
ncbi:hypothetical protein UFOVP1007_20 [uncultured Caudovirales phage]|uniref:Uncharacterized protein n=1 Tax=uncultured Caudovirales phage TaxID=2100421 RepID=A0A6J5PRU5_9CAUD|nr:hypothetical protein UFOVP927_43 [uncultured Caudovirales phage]CAB4178077.1 hypothetical protein UFOVP1007_20 [uncultured Caudovirales phage]CAB4187343.1 hypothetical protein UFOVP1159_20 [uncultured Caudovirales phage]